MPLVPGAGPIARLLPAHRAEADARIREAAWVARCVGRDVAALGRHAAGPRVRPGPGDLQGGRGGGGVWIVRAGRVELSVGSGSRRAVVAMLRPGDVDGDIPLLLAMPMPYTRRALTDARCQYLEAGTSSSC